MASRSCVSGCGRFLTSSDGHDRCPSCLGFRHAEAALVDESCSHCGNMTMAMLRSRYLLARRGGIPLALPRSSSSGQRTTSAQGQGDLRITVRASPSSTSPRASHSSSTSHRLGFPDEYAGSSDRAGPIISFGAPADDGVSITASGDELGSGEDDSAALPPSGRVALPESDPELTAMLSRAAESIGLHYRRPPSPERSRLDDWFLGAQAERRQPPPVPFFPEVHEEVTRSWKAPFSARNRPSASSVLTTLDGGAAQGYVEVPPVERAIAMQLCPQGAAAWRGNPRLPSRACKFSSALTAKAYGAAGQAASALHAMALLQVHQAKALKQLHEGDADPGVLQELRTATDLALRATKVTARALGQTMSTLVVQERHLWLTLADMRESDKHRFPDSPISQAGLFGEAVEDFAQQFSAAQKQTEAFRHILPRRSAAVSTPPPAAAPPSARRRGRPPAASTSAPARPQQQPALRPQRGAGRRRQAQPASAPAKPVKRQGRRRPWDGRPGAFGSCSSGDGDRTTPSPGGGPGGESFVSFLFCSAKPKTSIKEQFPFPPGPKRARMAVYETSSPHSRPPLSSPVGSRVRSEDATPSPASPAQLWSQVSVTPHTQTPLRDALPFESGPCAPFRCPTVGTSVTPLVPLVQSLGAWLELPRPSRWLLRTIRLGYAIQFARRPPKFRGIRFTSVLSKDAPVLRAEVAVLLAKDAIEPVPPAEMKSGFYSPYFIVPKKDGGLRPILDLRVLNRALHKLPFRMLTQRGPSEGGRGASPLGGALLAQSDLVPRTNAPRDSPSLANSSEEGSTFSERGHPLAPAPRLVESPRMVLGRDAEVLSGLPPAVVNTITSARALSTRQAYRLKWNLFVNWCSPRREDPRRCPIAVVLSFLQDGLERRLSPSTLKVYVAAIAAHHDAVDGKSLGKHDLVIRFLRGARRLNPPRPYLVPSWDLPSVLSALRGAPFEPLQSVELKFLSLKTVLLSALATVKRVGDLQAFSVDDSCLEFGPADSHVVLRPRPGYVPKVPTMPFRDQVVNLQALPREEADPAIALLCPVRALRIYVDRTQSFRTSDQLFVCFGGQQKGRAVSKQRLAHWIVEAIVLAYQARRLPCPLGVRAHSTRGVASSWALARGASIADICKAAGWATPNTFARFYNLRIEPVSSRVLVSDGQ